MTIQRRGAVKKVRSKPRAGRLVRDKLQELRHKCFMRDRGQCQECKKLVMLWLNFIHPDSFHMAHIQAKQRGGDSLNNVRTLCGQCHRTEHAYGKSMTKPCPPKVPVQTRGEQ